MIDEWLEPDPTPDSPEDYGYVHQDDLPDIDHIKDHLEGVIEAIYVTGKLDNLENHLDEVTCALDMELPKGRPVLMNLLSREIAYELGYKQGARYVG